MVPSQRACPHEQRTNPTDTPFLPTFAELSLEHLLLYAPTAEETVDVHVLLLPVTPHLGWVIRDRRRRIISHLSSDPGLICGTWARGH
jgi:hypothetical protein